VTRFLWFRGRRVPLSGIALPDSFSAVTRASGPVFLFCVPVLIFSGNEGVGSCFQVLRARKRFRRYRRRRLPFSYFALQNSFSAVPTASGPVFMFCAPGYIFGGAKGVGSRFHVLRSWTHYRRYRGRRIPFSCFALPDSFSTLRRASGLVFMFCVPLLIFGDTEGVVPHFHILRARTHFRRYRRR
jgi:hypothetical protein